MMNDQHQKYLSNLKCIICGEQDYEWGKLRNAEPFLPESFGFKETMKRTSFGKYNSEARRCNHCGNIQIFSP